jgi:hypothetical protein
VEGYNAAHAAHVRASIVSTVNGRDIRPVPSRSGTLYQCLGTKFAFPSLAAAEDYARRHPKEGSTL